MSIYVGIIVLEELQNKQRYDQTIKELSLFLKTHNAEIDLQIDDKFVSFKPIDGLSEINFPQNSTYFRTTYFRISIENQSDDIYLKRFCELVWECCCIFKENFPSRIELFQENLDQYINLDELSLNQELLRRQINSLLNKLSLQEKLKKDEIQDIFSVLENSITLQNLKGLKACLELLESELCAPCLLQQVSQKEIDLLESIDNDEGIIKQNFDSELLLKEYQDIRQCCQSILCKILRVRNQLQDNQNNAGAQQQNSIIQQLKKFEVVNYNQPTFKHSYIFQLRETSDIERITFILDTLMSKNLKLMEDLQQIGLPFVIGQIIEKYSDGEFGIDFSEVTQYCVFHNRLLKYLNRSMETQYSDFLYSDERDGVFAYKLFQILEEGVLNILKNTVNLDNREKFEKDLYLQQLITIYESFLNSERAKNSEQFQFHFKNHLITVKEISTSFLGIGSPEDLQSVSKELKQFYLNVSKLADRIEFAFAKRTVNFGNQQLNQSDNQIMNQINNYRQSYISAKEDLNASNQESAVKNWIQTKKTNQMKTNNFDLPRQQNQFEFSNQKVILNKSNLSQQENVNMSVPASDSKSTNNLISQQAAGLREQYARQQQQYQNQSQQQQEIFSVQDASLQDQLSRQQISNIDQFSRFSQQIPQQQSALSSIQYERNNIFSQKDSQSFIKENRLLNKNPFLQKYQQNDEEDYVRQETQ